MTEMDPEQPGSGTEAPAAPGAEVDTRRTAGQGQSRDTDQQDQNAEASGTEPEATGADQDEKTEPADDTPEATSPELEHLKDTIGKAQRAADAALAPQRE
jgi:hypothetical protein